ncbi:MAG TPA: M1 family aminopeptidase, partial [Candidatus Polarisedimenticolaceae bacterium]|nr:M1 family aminopeptidase [Candidatus Polarisedimenticolaceae bacterium]
MRVVAAGVVTAVLAGPGLGAAAAPVEHEIELALEPQSGRLTVRDRVTVRVGATTGSVVEFVLNERLELDPAAPVEPVGEPFSAARFELNGHQIARGGEATIRRYRLTDPLDRGPFTIAYTGAMAFELGEVHEEYTRGFRETIGQLGPDGVYLTADSFWYPYFGDGLVEYRMTVEQPDGWHVISAGRGRSRDDDDRAQWESEGAVDEIYLAGGPLYLHRDSVGAVETLVYLHEDDPALSERYLTATAQYLEMYRSMIGPYAYSKFALVENFWETGYGMPSFTLLGPRVIRLPFILHSSYPHEILHNWWGNGVFVDYDSGNWCEGLTAYLADHLVQEQRGQGAAYRRDTLQKYRDYVGENRDFPLEQFRTRHSAATEAVGYGKSLVGFHMLRMAMGDDVFRRALAELYREYRGRRASFDDLRRVFESASGLPLADFFRQWLTRTGAPALAARVAWCDAGTTLRVCGTLEQTQSGPPFAVDVPIVLDTADGPQEHTVRMKTREQGFALAATTPVWRVRVDPSFDVLRLLDPRETPPTIGQLFGEPRILAVLPSSDAPRREAYRALVEGWRSASHEIEVVVDAELAALPAGLSVWVLGRQNRFAGPLFGGGVPRGFELLPTSTAFGQQSVSSAGHSIVSVRRHPASERHAVGLLDVDPEAAFPGIGRKLPHYGKYSYLAFAGDEPENVIKGQWPTDDSPLVVELAAPPDPVGADPGAAPAERSALAELPPLFSRQALGDHVDYLASRELEGRGVGTTGLDRAAEYVAARFAAVGLEPAG